MSGPVVLVDSDSDTDVEPAVNKTSAWKKFLVPMGFNEDRVTEAADRFDIIEEAFQWLMETDEAAVGVKLASSMVPSQMVVQIDVDADDSMPMEISDPQQAVSTACPAFSVAHAAAIPPDTKLWEDSWASAGAPTFSAGSTIGISTTSAQTAGGSSRGGIPAVDLTYSPPSPPPVLSFKRRHTRATSPGGARLSAGASSAFDGGASPRASSGRPKTSSLACQVCEESVASTSVFTVSTCRHQACVPCLRRHVDARMELAESIDRHKISWPNSYMSSNSSSLATSPTQLAGSATAQRRRSSPVTRRSSKVAAQAASSVSPLSQVLVDPPESLSCVPSSFLLLTPLDCPVEDCDVPLPWPCLEDLTGSDRWQEFTGGCMARYQQLTSAVFQSRSVWVPCPGCRQKMMVDAETVTLPSGADVSKLTAADIKAELLQRGLVRSGSRGALVERLQGALKREAESVSNVDPPMLRCQNVYCTSMACVLCGHVEPGIPHAAKGRGSSSGSKDKSKALACQAHIDCPRKGLYQAVSLCNRLNTVLHRDTSLDVTSKKKKKTHASNNGGIGYSGIQGEKAGGSGREVEAAQEREMKADHQYMKMIQSLNVQLQMFAQNVRELCDSAFASSSASAGAWQAGMATGTATSPAAVSSSRDSPVIVFSSSSSSPLLPLDRQKEHATAAASALLDLSAVDGAGGSPAAGGAGGSPAASSPPRHLLTDSLLSTADGGTAAGGGGGGAMSQSSDVPHPLLHTAIRRDLLPALLLYLRNDSIIDVAKRPAVYSELFDLLSTMVNDNNLLWALGESFKDEDGDERLSVLALLQRLHKQACIFLKTGADDGSADSAVASTQHERAHALRTSPTRWPLPAPLLSPLAVITGFATLVRNDGGNEVDSAMATYTVAKRIDDVYTQMKEALSAAKQARPAQAKMLRAREVIDLVADTDSPPQAKRARANRAPSPSAGGAAATAPVRTAQELEKQRADAEATRLEQEYVEVMTEYRFQLADVYTASHCYYAMASSQSAAAPHRKRLLRIRQELASLSTSLPIEYRSSIFLCADDNRVGVMKALVVGPEDTPYANGLFEFDIFLPATYPNQPPCCRLITTNLGAVRFNPNLYACGKVCLSLLGTWQGPSWDSSKSTLLQVLVSIQAMILVPDPFFNEPGFDNSRFSPSGKWSSENYNARVREATVRFAMTKCLTSPSPLFAKVIREHFRLKADIISKQLEDWTHRAAIPVKPPGGITCEGGIHTSESSMKTAVLNFNDQLSQLKPIVL